MINTSLMPPQSLYPLFSPLPLPMVMHLVVQEDRRSRRWSPAGRPKAEQVWMVIEGRVREARTLVYEYMNPFVVADTQRSKQGYPRAFPSADWLLDALAIYTPDRSRNAPVTLDYWQKKGIVRRDKPRGLLDRTRVAALLIARIAEEEHQRNWLPSKISDDEQNWWCYEQAGPDRPVQVTRVPPSPTLSAAALLWTPWLGAAWEEKWSVVGNKAFRWAGTYLTEQDVELWDHQLVTTIRSSRSNILLSQETIQVALLQEASRMLLERLARQRQT